MDWDKFAGKVEANLNKIREEVRKHNKEIDAALEQLEYAEIKLNEIMVDTPFEFVQRELMRAQLTHMRIMLRKEYVPGWS